MRTICREGERSVHWSGWGKKAECPRGCLGARPRRRSGAGESGGAGGAYHIDDVVVVVVGGLVPLGAAGVVGAQDVLEETHGCWGQEGKIIHWAVYRQMTKHDITCYTVVKSVQTPFPYETTSSAPSLLSPNIRSTNVIGTSPTVYPSARARTIISIWNT